MPSLSYYSSPVKVREFTGIESGDLSGLDTDRKLNAQLEDWLLDIKSLIDEYVGRDFAQEEWNSRTVAADGTLSEPAFVVPRAIHNIALRAAKNMLAMAKLARNTGVVTADEVDQPRSPDTVLTNDIRADLKLFRSTIKDRKVMNFGVSVLPGRKNPILGERYVP